MESSSTLKKYTSFASASLLTIGLASISFNTVAQQSWSYTYHSNGQIETADGPRTDVNDITTMAYDSNGNVSSVTNALGHVQQYTAYDASGRVLQMIDANGIVSDFTYTTRGWLNTATLRAPVGSNGSDKLLQYGYDAVGQLTSMT
ncbi:RHS repeat domain-containing protein, partial [Aurantivibrio infirmus]